MDDIEEYFRSAVDWMDQMASPDLDYAPTKKEEKSQDEARAGYNLRLRRSLEGKDPSLGPTWWIMDRDQDLDDMAEKAGAELLQDIKDNLMVYPFRDTERSDRLFLMRFETPIYGERFQFEEAIFAQDADNIGLFMDYLAGFPIDCVEMLVLLGSISSLSGKNEPSKITVLPGNNKVFAPVPERFFRWPEEDKVLLNLTALPVKNVGKIMARNLTGEIKPHKPHWWFRVNVNDDPSGTGVSQKWPVPGELLCLGCRLFPGEPWGHQETNPFFYSANFLDTVFYTSGKITEIAASTDGAFPWDTITFRWRGKDPVTAIPMDFATYQKDDLVAVIKDINAEKTSQLWKDDDMTAWGDNWQIAAITFYYLGAFYPDKEAQP